MNMCDYGVTLIFDGEEVNGTIVSLEYVQQVVMAILTTGGPAEVEVRVKRISVEGRTDGADGYACDLHTARVERGALGSPDTIEFEAKELPK